MVDAMYGFVGAESPNNYPTSVNPTILQEVFRQKQQLIKQVKKRQQEDNNDGDDEEQQMEEEEEEEEFEMNDAAWHAIKVAIQNRIAQSEDSNYSELRLPRPTSAPIARYNPKGHFAFKKPLHPSMVCWMQSAAVL